MLKWIVDFFKDLSRHEVLFEGLFEKNGTLFYFYYFGTDPDDVAMKLKEWIGDIHLLKIKKAGTQ